jgi:CxxC motif-containing protein
MAQIRSLRLRAPVKAGDVLIRDLAGTGIDLIATRGADCA